jgi:hypothetical protein
MFACMQHTRCTHTWNTAASATSRLFALLQLDLARPARKGFQSHDGLMGANMKEFTEQAAHVVYSSVLVCTAHNVCTRETQRRALQAAGSLPCGD